MQGFEVAGASVPGTDHTMPGQPGWKNNQDAFSIVQTDTMLAAVVCDGCGSAARSEVGAQLAAAFTTRTLARLVDEGFSLETVLTRTADRLTGFISTIAHAMVGSFIADIERHFLFTTIGVVMTPERTAVFALGDGVYAVNGEVAVIEPYAHNAPPYIGYRLTGGPTTETQFKACVDLPTSAITSLLIGSDGVGDLIKAERTRIPGTEEEVGALSRLWTDEAFFRNPDALRRHLARINRETVAVVNGNPRIVRGPLRDDTTIIALRRVPIGEKADG